MVSRVRDLMIERPTMDISAAGQRYQQQERFIYLGGCITETADIWPEMRRRKSRAHFKLKTYGKQLFDATYGASLRTKIRLLKSEVIEALLYGVETWTMVKTHYEFMRKLHYHFLMRCIGFKKRRRNGHPWRMSYREALRITRCESLETTIRRRRLEMAGSIVRMSDERLPKVMLFGELKMENEQAGPQGRPPKNWRQCLYDDLNAFEIEIETWISKAADAAGSNNWVFE